MFLAIYLLSVVAILALFYASYSISLGVYMKSLCSNRENRDSVALTFDDGVDVVMTPKVLDVLRKYNAKATFFLIGEKASRYPELVKEIIAQGHSIGNHSYTHKWYFPMKSTRTLSDEIILCTETLEKISESKVKLFRPPFGVTNPMIAKAIKQSKLISIGWSLRSFDTMGSDIDRIKQRVSHRLQAGKVILLHDNRPHADVLLDNILQEIVQRGLKTVTIEEFFKLQ